MTCCPPWIWLVEARLKLGGEWRLKMIVATMLVQLNQPLSTCQKSQNSLTLTIPFGACYSSELRSAMTILMSM